MGVTKSTTLYQAFSAEAIAKSGVAYTDIIPIDKLAGRASLHIILTGTGTGQFQCVASNDETDAVTDFVIPNGMADIVTAQTVGTALYTFTPPCARRMAIKVTETGGANAIAVTAYLALQ